MFYHFSCFQGVQKCFLFYGLFLFAIFFLHGFNKKKKSKDVPCFRHFFVQSCLQQVRAFCVGMYFFPPLIWGACVSKHGCGSC